MKSLTIDSFTYYPLRPKTTFAQQYDIVFKIFVLGTVRRFLEHFGDTVDRVVFVVTGANDVSCVVYNTKYIIVNAWVRHCVFVLPQ